MLLWLIVAGITFILGCTILGVAYAKYKWTDKDIGSDGWNLML